MFHGQPYCRRCGYEGPDFMWMPHFGRGVGVLVQDLASRGLRVVWVPDEGADRRRDGLTEGEREEAWEAYVDAFVTCELRPGERPVPVGDFVELSGEGATREETALPCPRCPAALLWRHTGIS